MENKQQTAEQACCFFHTVFFYGHDVAQKYDWNEKQGNNSIKVALVYVPGVGLVQPNSPRRLAMKSKI